MKGFLKSFLLFAVSMPLVVYASTISGFFLPDSVEEMSFRYRRFNNLIILRAKLNDTLNVDLVFDTGCRNIVLFGKKFDKLFQSRKAKEVSFKGLGKGHEVKAWLCLGNKFLIDGISGENIPIVVSRQLSVFKNIPHVDGMIGYDLLSRFEIEINPHQSRITFRSPHKIRVRSDFNSIPMFITDAVPKIEGKLSVNGENIDSKFLLDTGSELGLLLRTTKSKEGEPIGQGLNGYVFGSAITGTNFCFKEILVADEIMGFIANQSWNSSPSIGMGFLKDFSFIINSVQGSFHWKYIKTSLPLPIMTPSLAYQNNI